MPVNKTWYLDETTVELLNEIKINNNFRSMNQVIGYLLNTHQEHQSCSSKFKLDDNKLRVIDKNIEILMEIIPVMADKQNTAPLMSYKTGVVNAYNKAKEIVDERIDKETRTKKENHFFNLQI